MDGVVLVSAVILCNFRVHFRYCDVLTDKAIGSFGWISDYFVGDGGQNSQHSLGCGLINVCSVIKLISILN
jgi:hypothetical protein